MQVNEKLYPSEDDDEEDGNTAAEDEENAGENEEQEASTVDVIQALLDESKSLVPHPAVEKTRSEMQVRLLVLRFICCEAALLTIVPSCSAYFTIFGYLFKSGSDLDGRGVGRESEESAGFRSSRTTLRSDRHFR